MKHLVAYFAFGGLLVSALVGCGDTSGTPNGGTAGSGGAATNNPMAGNGTGGSGAGMSSGAGSGQMGGADGAGSGMGGSAGSGGGAAGAPHKGPYENGSCSDPTVVTDPPKGLESFKQPPIDQKFPFSSHWMGAWPAATEPKLMGQTAMADFDDDGDLDFGAGQRDVLPGGYYWWERCTDDHWVSHLVGTGQKSDSSGYPIDVNKDGMIDIVTGDSWFENPGKPRDMPWIRHGAGHDLNAEDLVVGDVTGDDVPEILYVNNDFTPTWYKIGDNPDNGFVLGGKLGHTIQQGVAWGDLNGDGTNDWLISAQWWYESVNKGASFTEHQVTAANGFDANNAANAPLTFVGDVDADGDNDFAAGSHWLGGNDNAQLAWFENTGNGASFTKHQLSSTGLYSHGVILADFDNDGDLDLLWARNVGPSFIYDNTDGKGTFVEHKIVNEFRGHTPRIGDVDCDGDLDIAGGPWGDQGPADHGETSKPPRDYMYLKNHAVEMGAKPILDKDRKPYELGWRNPYHCR